MAKLSKKIVKNKPKNAKLPEKIIGYLEKAGVPHELLKHRTVYTAMDTAVTMRKKMGEIAKSLLVKADKDYFLIILPADNNIDFKKLNAALSKFSKKKYAVVKIPGEKIMTEFLKLKAGTISAFGGLHNLPVVLDKNLARIKKAIFSTGNFNYSVEMGLKDFIRLENALLANFGVKKKIKLPKKVKPAKKSKIVNSRTVKSKKTKGKK